MTGSALLKRTAVRNSFTLTAVLAFAAYIAASIVGANAAYAQAEIKRVRCTVTARVDLAGNPFNGVQIKVNINDVIDMVAGADDTTTAGVNVWSTSDPSSPRMFPMVYMSPKHKNITPVDAAVDPGASVEWDSLYDPLNPDPTQVDPILDIQDNFAEIDEDVTVHMDGWWLDPDDIDAAPVHIASTKSGTCVDGGTSQRFKQDTKCDKNADRPGCEGFIATVERAQYEDGKGWNIQGLANGGDSVTVELVDLYSGLWYVAKVTAAADGKWSYQGAGVVTPADGDTLSVSTALGTVSGFSIDIK